MPQFLALALFAATFVSMLLMGRVVCRVLLPQNNLAAPLLPEWVVGFGAYQLLLVLFSVLGLNIVWGAVLVTVVGIVMFMAVSGRFDYEEETEHMVSTVVLGFMLLVPVVAWLWGVMPPLLSHYAGSLSVLSAVEHNAGWWGQQVAAAMFAVPLVSGLVVGGTVFPQGGALLQVMVLALAAPALAHLTGIKTRWSNLPLVVAGALLGATVLNPMWQWQAAPFYEYSFLLAAVALAAFMPLLSSHKLPEGMAVLPWALALAVLVAFGGPAFMLLVPLLWLLRQALNPLEDVDIPGLMLLLAAPFMSLTLWQVLTGMPLQWLPHLATWPQFVAFFKQMLVQYPLALLWAAGLVAVAVWKLANVRNDAHATSLAQYSSWYMVPALAAVGVALLAPQRFAVLQFVLLVPLWHVARFWYEGTGLKALAYKAPWGIGFVLAALFVGGQFARQPYLAPQPQLLVRHGLDVATALGNAYVQPQQLIAVINPSDNQPASAVVRYALAQNPVVDVTASAEALKQQYTTFHQGLVQAGVSWVWVAQPTAAVATLLNAPLQADRSYLFRVDTDGLYVAQTFRHPLSAQ